MNERKCLWCNRWQSEHEGMTFASQDRWCKCSICLQSKKRNALMDAQEGTPQPAYVRPRVNRRNGKDNRNVD